MSKESIELCVNGDRYEVVVDARRSLAEVLREELGLIGTKVGCGQGDCGACTVILDGFSVCSCLTLAVEAQGLEIETIEGLAPSAEELHPIQQAFVEVGAVQCGYCTPGMVLTAKALLERHPDPTEAEVRHGLSGNLCRCTGYQKIVEAVLDAAGRMKPEGGVA